MIDNLSPEQLKEFAHLMLGEKRIGYGMSRVVYDHPHDPTKVIKVEAEGRFFQNVMEWEIWREWSHDDDVAKWLAPCHQISASGRFLIQAKAFDCRPEDIPKKLPRFLTDHKPDNFGVMGFGKKKRVVSRDYGIIKYTLNDTLRNWRDN